MSANTNPPTWAAVIQARRDQLGISQAQLARLAGVPKGTFQRYETGDREPPLSVARAIAEALDVSLAELAGQVPAGEDQWRRLGSPLSARSCRPVVASSG